VRFIRSDDCIDLRRKGHNERRACPGALIPGSYRSAVGLDEIADDRESKPQTAMRSRCRAIDLAEACEDRQLLV
jgi:hypothetical protein